MHKNMPKEKCELCHKFIYIHDIALVCNLDSKIYHAKCLNIENDIAIELQILQIGFVHAVLSQFFHILMITLMKKIIAQKYAFLARNL